MKKRILTILTSLAILLTLAACNSSSDNDGNGGNSGELKEIRIGFPSSGAGWPSGALGVSLTNGYLDEYLAPLGYKASPQGFVGAAPAIHEALVAKELDYVIYAGFAGTLSNSNGIDHKLISVTSWGGTWKLLVRSDAGIDSIADLRGKKVAYQRGATPHMYLLKVLAEGGLTINDIEAINSTIPDGLAGIASGTIDAAVIGSGQENEFVKDGTGRVLHSAFHSDKNVYNEPSVFIARTEFHKANPDVAVAIQKALYKGKEWIKEDPDRYFQLVSDTNGTPLEFILETANYNIDESIPLDLDEKYINSLKSILAFQKENELTSGDVDFDSWVDRSVVEKAWEEYSREE